MKWKYILERATATLADKFFIAFISGIIIFVASLINSEWIGNLGTYSALFHMSVEEVYNTAVGHVMLNFPNDYIANHQAEIDDYYNYLKSIDIAFTSIFVFINICYYFTSEKKWGASVFKHVFKMKIVYGTNYQEDQIINSGRVLLRALVFLFLMIAMVLIRWVAGINYFFVIFLFFLLLDLPVLFFGKSLLDILTNTRLVYFSNEEQTLLNVNKKEVAKEQSDKITQRNNSSLLVIKNIKIVLWLLFILISLISIHNILTYFFADYYNTLAQNISEDHHEYYNYHYEYYGEKRSNNYKRKHGFVFYPLERFSTRGSIFKTSSSEDMVFEIASLFEGKFISKYEYHGKNTYYVDERGYYVDDYYRWGCTEKYVKYKNSISTYDISENVSIFKRSDSEYEKILSTIESNLKTKFISPSRCTILGKEAIRFYFEKGYAFEGAFVLSNNRLYYIETASDRPSRTSSLFDKFCSELDYDYAQGDNYLWCYFLIIILCCICIIGYNIIKNRRKEISNRYAYSLFIFCVVSLIANIIIASCQAYRLFTEYSATFGSFLILFGSLLTAICIAPLCVFYLNKSKIKWSDDYYVPKCLKNVYNNMKSATNKSAYRIAIVIPLMFASLLPILGAYIVLFYVLPVMLFTYGWRLYQKWMQWMQVSKIESKQ